MRTALMTLCLLLSAHAAWGHGLEWTGGEQDGEAVSLGWTNTAPIPVHVWVVRFETDAEGRVQRVIEEQHLLPPRGDLELWTRRDGVPPFTERVLVFAALSEGEVENVRRALRAVPLSSGAQADLRTYALGKELLTLERDLGLRARFDNASPRFQTNAPRPAGPDPWALYRRVGRAWTHQRTLVEGGRSSISALRRTVRSCGEVMAEVQLTITRPGRPPEERTETVLLPRTLSGVSPSAPGPVETITVPAGTFSCFKVVRGEATTWSSTELPGLVVKSVHPDERLELVELVR